MINQPYLEHHGIQGMKWGVRRYQNKNGTLTAAGKARYQNPDGSPTVEARMKYNISEKGRYSEKSRSQKYKEKQEAKNYNYKNSEEYKNGDRETQKMMKKEHKTTAKHVGERTARKIDYRVANYGANRNSETLKEEAKQAAVKFGLFSAMYLPDLLIDQGTEAARNMLEVKNAAVNEVSISVSPDVKRASRKGAKLGSKAIKVGKKAVETMFID